MSVLTLEIKFLMERELTAKRTLRTTLTHMGQIIINKFMKAFKTNQKINNQGKILVR